MKKSNVSFIAQMCEIKLIVPNPYAINVCSININYPFASESISKSVILVSFHNFLRMKLYLCMYKFKF